MKLHSKGPKAQRDRDLLLKFYDNMAKYFPSVKRVDTSTLINKGLKDLCYTVWNGQNEDDQLRYLSDLKTIVGREPVKIVWNPKAV